MTSRPLVAAGALLAAVLGGLALQAATAPGGAAQDQPAGAKLADLAWLAGHWRHAEDGGGFDEMWLPPGGDAMAAVSRNVEHGKVGMYELSAIEATAGGLVLRIRHFGGGLLPWKSEAAAGTPSWPLVKHEKQEAVFEEASIPFPRRIVYRREAGAGGKPDVLVARLEGERGGKPMEMEFRLDRVGP